MLPSEDALAVGEEMQRRFGLRNWQFTLSATDANRFVIRISREITGRSKILVYNHCYHGTVDETVGDLAAGEPRPARAASGRLSIPQRPPASSRSTTSKHWSGSWPTATSPVCWSSRH